MHPILRKLEQGDRRSIGRSNEVVLDVLAEPRLFRAVFSGLYADDPLVRMRSADAAEKITARRPELRVRTRTGLFATWRRQSKRRFDGTSRRCFRASI